MEPKHRDGYRLGIVNSMTLVGNEIKSILRERSFPCQKLVLLDSTGEGAGSLTEVDHEPAVVAAASDEELEDLDLVFFCGPPAANREWIERHGAARFVAIDLSQPTTAGSGRVTVAGINLEGLTAADRLLVSPHPVAIPLALILHQIGSASPVKRCTATVIQPASEYGQAGIEELARQTISVLNVQSVPQSVFDRQVAFNLFPARERNEEFIVGQVRALAGPRMDVALLVTQGTIFHGHTFSLFVETGAGLEEREVIEALRRNRAIAFPEGDQQFGSIDAAGRDEVLIAEARADRSIEGGFWVWAVCDNLRRSSALNAVLIAESVLAGTGAPN
ncbi:MAG TPA: Asd/ArgC dimerization domain-containing protein [Thermoanaerobaculia bacterium]|nr:Asd/ArgC dimerization domain-containing protein [Thermoanaerobaculia bacterium]